MGEVNFEGWGFEGNKEWDRHCPCIFDFYISQGERKGLIVT
jgi:hypothetical protein